MYKTLLFSIVLMVAMSCQETKTVSPTKTTETKSASMSKPMTLTGKKVEYNYGDYIYHLDFISEDQLRWECVEGDEKGKSDTEKYATQRLNDHTFFLSWVEADGLGVSQVLNMKDMKINCYLKIDKDIIPLSGTVKQLK